jgi:ABC-type dipeptide/oligopeptide/nickel transport system permease component
MIAFITFLFRRLMVIPITLIVITAVLYAFMMLVPAEERATLFLPPVQPRTMTAEKYENIINRIIAENGLNDPYPRQYWRWATNLLRGDWGYSPFFNAPVLDLLQGRTAVTLELTFYAILLLIPLGLISGVLAGWWPGSFWDNQFRFTAFMGTAVPPFILGLFLLSVFYVGLGWFPIGTTSLMQLRATGFRSFTGFLTVDGLLNGRADVTLFAFRRLALPVFTLSLAHWATLGRITRVSVMDEAGKEYILAARARGLRRRSLIWRHIFRNVLAPALTSSSLSAASLITGVFVVEVVFNYKGLSELITDSMRGVPDSSLVLGFAVYSVLLVVPIMLFLDVLKAIVDPRIRAASENNQVETI